MKCEDVALHLEPYLRGDIGGAEREWLASHLATCSSCQQEAIFMQEFTERVEAGLKAWIDSGEVPPKVAAQIRAAVRAESRPSWQRWVVMGTAVAAALFIGVFLINVDNPGAGATGSFMSSITNLVRQPAPELIWGSTAAKTGASKVVPVGAAASGRGVTMTVTSVEFGSDFTGVDYTLTGVDAKLTIKRPNWLAAMLSVEGKPATLRSGKAWIVRDGVISVRAIYDRVPAGQAAVFTLPGVVTDQQPAEIALPLLPDSGTQNVDGMGVPTTAAVTAVQVDQGQASITVRTTGALMGATAWVVRDSANQTYEVQADTPEQAEQGYTQDLTGNLSAATKPLTLVAQHPITLRTLHLAVDLPKAP